MILSSKNNAKFKKNHTTGRNNNHWLRNYTDI